MGIYHKNMNIYIYICRSVKGCIGICRDTKGGRERERESVRFWVWI